MIVEAEKQKVLTYHEQLMEKREKEEIPYNPDLDYSFLRICKMGKSNITPRNQVLKPIPQVRVSARTRSTVHTHIWSDLGRGYNGYQGG